MLGSFVDRDLRRKIDYLKGFVARVRYYQRKYRKDDIRDGVVKVMERHAGDSHPAGPHDAWLKFADAGPDEPPTATVHHQHHRATDSGILATCKDDLLRVPGVTGVSQSTNPPKERGYVKIHSHEPSIDGAGIVGVMSRHEKDAPEGEPHDAFTHSKSGLVHHHHGRSASESHLDAVAEDLAAVHGVKEVFQSTAPPMGDNLREFVHAYRRGQTYGDAEAGGPEGDGGRAPWPESDEGTEEAKAGRCCCKGRACADLCVRGKCNCKR